MHFGIALTYGGLEAVARVMIVDRALSRSIGARIERFLVRALRARRHA